MAILGVWMWATSVQIHGAEKAVGYCARAGVTDIYFLVKGMGGKTAHRGKLAPSTCERDLLRETLDVAHRYGIRVHAWFVSTFDGVYCEKHPESSRVHLINGRDSRAIEMRDEGYLTYIENMIAEVMSNYDVDGFHLDYIRYNHMLYGWSEKEIARYKAEGADVDKLRSMLLYMHEHETRHQNGMIDAYRGGDMDVHAFARARRKDVVNMAKRFIAAARGVKPNTAITAALLPEGAYEDISFADLHYGQNYLDAAPLYDYVTPMIYSVVYKEGPEWVRKAAETSIRRGLKTVVGLHAYEAGTGPSLLADQKILAGLPIHGIALFREGATAMAFSHDRELSIYNAMDAGLTRVEVLAGEETAAFDLTIASGEEKKLLLPFTPECVRVFAGETERCVYVAKE